MTIYELIKELIIYDIGRQVVVAVPGHTGDVREIDDVRLGDDSDDGIVFIWGAPKETEMDEIAALFKERDQLRTDIETWKRRLHDALHGRCDARKGM